MYIFFLITVGIRKQNNGNLKESRPLNTLIMSRVNIATVNVETMAAETHLLFVKPSLVTDIFDSV